MYEFNVEGGNILVTSFKRFSFDNSAQITFIFMLLILDNSMHSRYNTMNTLKKFFLYKSDTDKQYRVKI